MKWNNPILVFDLETTTEPIHEIIEIGAVLLDQSLSSIGEYQDLVYAHPVDQKALDITKISGSDIESAPTWSDVAYTFELWAKEKSEKKLNNLRLAAWGNYFDINVLRAQYARHGLEYPFSGTCIDVKTAALMWLSLSGRRTDKCSVPHVAEEMGIEPVGQYHRALVDALMTAKIFQRVMKDLSCGVWNNKEYIRIEVEK